MSIKLEVGKTYLARNGEEITITANRGGDSTYPYLGYSAKAGDTLSWTKDGTFDIYHTRSDYALVKEVTKPVPRVAAKPQTPEEMQRGLAEYMGFTVGTKVRVVAKVEEANGATVCWATESMDKLLAERAVGVVVRVADSGHISVRFTDKGLWCFLPQSLEHATPQPTEVVLNHAYTATVFPNSGGIMVGPLGFNIEALREVVKVWEELNPGSAVK